MFGLNAGESKTYGVKFQARCIAAQSAEKHLTRFLIGTLSLREENEVHLIQLADDGSGVVCEGLFAHQHEIWDLAACPFSPLLFSTVYAAAGEYHAAIWRFPGDKDSGQALETAATLSGISAPIRRVLWHGSAHTRQIVSLDEESVRLWDVGQAAASVAARGVASAGTLQQIGAGAWDPNDPQILATTSDSSITLWDLRAMSKVGSIDGAHSMAIRDVDFNPSHHTSILMSAGDDSKIKIWDLRALPHACLVELPGHAHWVWRARFNPCHDELILSCGTDSTVNLWHVPPHCARSSAAPGNPMGLKSPVAASRVATPTLAALSTSSAIDSPAAAFTDFEDSVYGIAWSAADPWVFASLSYDGRVVVDVVPPTVRSQVGR